MKPDWKSAPKWANYLAMDSDGVWCWFEKEPTTDDFWRTWGAVGESREEMVSLPTNEYWESTKEKRPE